MNALHAAESTPASPHGPGREEGIVLAGLTALFLITFFWWALALWPVANAPYWLERTRYVCFGVAETGLPDTAGWVGLIAGPLGMLIILLVGWGRGVRALFARGRTSTGTRYALRGLAAGTLIMVMGAGHVVGSTLTAARLTSDAYEGVPSTYPRLDRDSPPLELVGQDGARHALASFAGRPVLVTFAYAHCTTICPLIVQDVLGARDLVIDETGVTPAVFIVTLDPWRDTPSRLPSMARSWGVPPDDAFVLSGTAAEVEAVLDAWEVPRSRDLRTGEVTHPSLAYVIDPAGRIAFASTGDRRTIVSLVKRAVGESR